jgi:hypothetical protein
MVKSKITVDTKAAAQHHSKKLLDKTKKDGLKDKGTRWKDLTGNKPLTQPTNKVRHRNDPPKQNQKMW